MNITFFVLSFIIYLSLSGVVFAHTGKGESGLKEKIKKHSKQIILACLIISAIILILDITNILYLDGYKYITFWCGIMCIISAVSLKCRVPDKFKPIFWSTLRSAVVCLAIELFVFNFNSAHLLSGDFEEKQLELSSSVMQNFNISSGQNISEGLTSLEFKGINMNVGTLTIKGKSNKKSSVTFTVDMSDETYAADYRYGIATAQVIRNNKRSQTIPCNFSGKVSNLKISFNTESGEHVTIAGIYVNKPIMLHFSVIRFLLMFLGSLAVFSLSSRQLLRRKYSERRKAVAICAWCFTFVLIGASLFITNMSRYCNKNHSIHSDFMLEDGNQITKEIVDSFENGRTDLDIDMNETLLGLENPYDSSQRIDIGAYPWDHLLYNGKYYSYYGIGPVLALFLPYHKLTGYYFPSIWAVWLFGVLGIFFLTKLYLSFMDKFFRNTYASLVLTGLIIIQFSTGIFFNYYYANFYEIAQTSGFLCVTAGAYFLISSNVIGKGKIKNWRLAISSFCLSMGVLCRPTLAVYCIAALLFIWAGFRKKKSIYENEKGSRVKYYAPYLLCALLPFALIGSIQIWYNYARFGNPFDFGIQYSLTINDFTHAQYHTHFVWIGFFNYILAFPKFLENFPFLTAERPYLFQPQGYYFVATGAALGLLWRAMPILAYGKSLKAYRLSKNPNKKLYTLLIIAVCIACPFAIIFSIWESGYGTRYCVDFAWQLILGALIICFVVHQKCRENTKAHLNKLMIMSTIVSFVMNFIQLYSYNNPITSFNIEWQAKSLAFARLFEFWR
ncbi:MAG: hypothetical protein J1F02_10825 [Lachnospiraceae bacterium]|nr:hypothetical protein [Lachnospiraceae bacterium]